MPSMPPSNPENNIPKIVTPPTPPVDDGLAFYNEVVSGESHRTLPSNAQGLPPVDTSKDDTGLEHYSDQGITKIPDSSSITVEENKNFKSILHTGEERNTDLTQEQADALLAKIQNEQALNTTPEEGVVDPHVGMSDVVPTSIERASLSASAAAGMIHGILGSRQGSQAEDTSQNERVVRTSPQIADIPAAVQASIDTHNALQPDKLGKLTDAVNDRVEREKNSPSKKVLRATSVILGAIKGAASRLIDASEVATRNIAKRYKEKNVRIEREAHTDIPDGVVFEVDASHPVLTDVHLHDEHPDGAGIPTMTHEGVIPPTAIHGEHVEEKNNSNEQVVVEPSSNSGQQDNNVEISHVDWFHAEENYSQEVSPDEALVAAQEDNENNISTLETISQPDREAQEKINSLELLVQQTQGENVILFNSLHEISEKLNKAQALNGELLYQEALKDAGGGDPNDYKLLIAMEEEKERLNRLDDDTFGGHYNDDNDIPETRKQRIRSCVNSLRARFDKLRKREAADSKSGNPQVIGNEITRKSDSEAQPHQSSKLEKIGSAALGARLRIMKAAKPMTDFYNRQPDGTKKLIQSGALIAASMGIGFLTPASAVGVAAVGVAKFGIRGYGAYKAGEGAEKILRARIGKMRASNDATSIERADKLEKREKVIKYGAMLTVFMLGSAVDIYHGLTGVGTVAADHAAGAVGNAVEHATAQASNATEAAHAAGVPTTGVSEMVDAASAPTVADVATPTPTPVPVDTVVSAAPTEMLHNHLVSQGDSLGKLFKQPEFSKLLPGFDDLKSDAARNNYLMNFFEKLTPDQLKSGGVTSGSADLIKIDENLNMEKIASFAKDMKVPTKSGLLNLFRRASGI